MNWIRKPHNKALQLSAIRKKQNQFVLLALVLVLGVLLWRQTAFEAWASFDALPFAVVAAFAAMLICYRKALQALLYCWFFIGMIVGEVVSAIVLFSLFYLVFTPLGLLMKKGKKGWVVPSEKNDFNNMF